MSNYRNDYRQTERDYYWTLPRLFFSTVVGLAAVCGIVFALNYFGLMSMGFFAPRVEAIRRDQMINSRSYTEGTIRELYTLQRQYVQAKTDDERAILAAAARHQFSIFPKDRLPTDLQMFMAQVGG